jgi:hypothetical protein
MYTHYTSQDQDRGGTHYRLIADDMLSRLQAKLGAGCTTPGSVWEANMSDYVKAVSSALWGVYCIESCEKFTRIAVLPQSLRYLHSSSRTALVYLQPPRIRAPHVSRRSLESIDPYATCYSNNTQQMQVSVNFSSPICDISEWLYHAVTQTGCVDVEEMIIFYWDARHWSTETLPTSWAEAISQPKLCKGA